MKSQRSARGKPGRALVAFLVLAGVSLGCGGSSRFQATYPVHGQVFFEGKPAAGAIVFLHGLEGQANEWTRPNGVVDENGDFVLTTYRQHDGAPAGKFAVTVSWTPVSYTQPIEEVNKLPMRYNDPETSGLVVELKPGDNQLPRFDLVQ
jgi:hypothetical protein